MGHKVILAVFALLVLNICYAGKDKMKAVFCSDDPDTKARLAECTAMMPEKAHDIKMNCMKEVAPEITDEDAFTKACCDESTGVGQKMQDCMMGKQDEFANLPPEDMKKIVQALECLTGMMA